MLDLIGSVIDTGVSAYNAHKQRELQRESLAHQKDMDKHGVAIRAADMRAAGINPIMAAGDAASSSASAGSGMPVSSNIGSSALKAAEAARANKEANMFDAQTANLNANSAKAAAESRLDEANAATVDAMRPELLSQAHSAAVKAANDARIEDTWYGRNIAAPARSLFNSIGGILGKSTSNFDHSTGRSSRSVSGGVR
jgi:hypothetical protein